MTIPYATKSWNVTDGCDPVSEACLNCWAASTGKRFWGERPFSDVQFHTEKLETPYGWRRPQTVAVSFMGDLFHPKITPAEIARVFAVMADNPQHRFLILTKRVSVMYPVLTNPLFREWIQRIIGTSVVWPLPNVWIGVTAENQEAANWRLPALMDTPAAHRWVSIEPMLGPLSRIDVGNGWIWDVLAGYHYKKDFSDHQNGCAKLDAVIAGCESGPKRRRTDKDWLVEINAACEDENTPCYIKQWQEELNGKVYRDPFPADFWERAK